MFDNMLPVNYTHGCARKGVHVYFMVYKCAFTERLLTSLLYDIVAVFSLHEHNTANQADKNNNQ